MLKHVQIQNILFFLDRVQLSGKEAIELVLLQQTLQIMLKNTPPEVPVAPSATASEAKE